MKDAFQNIVLIACLSLLAIGASALLIKVTWKAARRIGSCGLAMVGVSIVCISIGSVKFQPGLRDGGDTDIALGRCINWVSETRYFSSNDPVYVTMSNTLSGVVTTNSYVYGQNSVYYDYDITAYDFYIWWRLPGARFSSDETIRLLDPYTNLTHVMIPYSVITARTGDYLIVDYRPLSGGDWTELSRETIQSVSGEAVINLSHAETYEYLVYTSYVPENVHTNGVYILKGFKAVDNPGRKISRGVNYSENGKSIGIQRQE